MMTHGWRRFKWEELFAGRFSKPKFARDTSYLTLSGKLLGVAPGQVTPGAAIILLMKQKDVKPGIDMLSLSPDGSFNDPSVILFDTAHIYYQLPKKSGLGGASVEFMPGRLPAPTSQPPSRAIIWSDTIGMNRQIALVKE